MALSSQVGWRVRWTLPPLILHPFTGPGGPEKVLESSRANLMLQGLLPNDQFTAEDLNSKLLEGRFAEICMLYYVGKDLHRWMEQCMGFVEHTRELHGRGIRSQSFAALLIENAPTQVKEKLHQWGVVNYRALFSRAIGLYSVFGRAPELQSLSPEFIRDYYRYADYLFECRQQLAPFTELNPDEFDFELYASREYSLMLERQWGAE